MVRRGPGRPCSTPADRARRLRLRNARRLHLRFEGSHLRAATEAVAARGPRRSLRIQYLVDNAPPLHQGRRPWYRLVLFGEPEYFQDNETPPDSYFIIVTNGNDEDFSDY
jgi:hypothetical protein